MPTIKQQIDKLTELKTELVQHLNDKGVVSSNDEKYNTLIPKVGEIEIGAKVNAYGFDGTPIPSSGTFETFYLNKRLSNEKIDTILGSVLDSMSENTLYFIVRNGGSAMSGYYIRDLYIKRVGTTYSIIAYYWRPNSMYTKDIYTSTSGFISANMEYLFDDNGKYLDTAKIDITQNGSVSNTQFKYNDKLSLLFSLTPFTDSNDLDRTIELTGEYIGKNIEITENQTLDVESLLMENEFPLKIKVEVESPEVIPEGYILPEGTLDITSNGEHNVTEYAKVNVNIQSEGSTLKKFLDLTKSCKQICMSNKTITTLVDYIQYSDTENVSDFSYAFYYCNKLASLPLFDTGKATTMENMLYGCSELTSLPHFDTKNVTSMSNMLSECTKLTTIGQLNTGNVTNLSYTFQNCKKLKLIDLSHYKISSASNGYYAFYSCYSLKALIIRSFGSSYVFGTSCLNGCYHFLGTTNSTYNPTGAKDGYIYVPRAMVDTLKSATNWSTYADQIRALEDYTLDGTTTGELNLTAMGLGG